MTQAMMSLPYHWLFFYCATKFAEMWKTRPNTLICSPRIPHVIQNSWRPLCDLSHSGNYMHNKYQMQTNIQTNIIPYAQKFLLYVIFAVFADDRLTAKIIVLENSQLSIFIIEN